MFHPSKYHQHLMKSVANLFSQVRQTPWQQPIISPCTSRMWKIMPVSRISPQAVCSSITMRGTWKAVWIVMLVPCCVMVSNVWRSWVCAPRSPGSILVLESSKTRWVGVWHMGLNGTKIYPTSRNVWKMTGALGCWGGTYMDRVRSAQLWWLAFHG